MEQQWHPREKRVMSAPALLIFHEVHKYTDGDVCMFASPCYDLDGLVRKILPSLFAMQTKGVDVQFVYNYSYFTCSKGSCSFVIEHSDQKYMAPTRFSTLRANFSQSTK